MVYNCCLIGYGRVGRLHYTHLVNHPNISLEVIVETPDILSVLDKDITNISLESDIEKALTNNSIDIVFVCSPTELHYEHIMLVFKHNKHVFCEKPLSDKIEHIEECYNVASEKNLILLCAFNRRFDPQLMNLNQNTHTIGDIMQVSTISRDYPYPLQSFLKISKGIYRDCAIHDVDYICWLLKDKPITVYTTGNIVKSYEEGMGELDNVLLIMEFADGKMANVQLSRISQNYDQRTFIFGKEGTLEMKNPYNDNSKPISFPERYYQSYGNELQHFLDCIEGKEDIRVTKDDCLNVHYIIDACEKSYQTGTKTTVKYGNGFRDYSNVVEAVKDNYYKARIHQTVEYVTRMRNKYLVFDKPLEVMNVFKTLDKFVDISDPDISLPNYHHGLQTAQMIRKDNYPEWLQLIGLIHDLGKIMYLWGCDEDGTSIKQQWGIVGDTFIVGCKIPDTVVFPEFNKENPDSNNPSYNTTLGIYKEHCGLDQTMCSWGHDEYLYQVLKHNKVTLPEEALYVIRYHSLYPYHNKGSYSHLVDEKDKQMFEWLKTFNQYDLYSKSDENIDTVENREYYNKLINKYLNGGKLYF